MLKRSDLWSLEEYAEQRAAFRAEVLEHKRDRRVLIGDNVLLMFEDVRTIKYQIQEMLRIEKVFEAAGIQDELDAYNPLIPDGDNWKCTMLIQYQDVAERKQRLAELVGVEQRVWVQVGDCGKLHPIADEDLERSNDDKTSAVHFLRFQLTPDMVQAAKSNAPIRFGIDHPGYAADDVQVPASVAASLTNDLK